MKVRAGVDLIDVHAYIGTFPDALGASTNVFGLLESMDRFGIQRAVVGSSASIHHDPVVGNRELAAALEGQSRLYGCWEGLPDSAGETGPAHEFVTTAIENRVVAFRIHPTLHGYDLNGPDLVDLLGELEDYGLPVFLDRDQASWGEVERLAFAHPLLSIVVSGIGYRELRQLAGVLKRHPNVHLDLVNFSSHQGLEWVVEEFGASRILFGTGAPLRDPAESVTRLLWSGLSSSDSRAIGGGNALSLLRMPVVAMRS